MVLVAERGDISHFDPPKNRVAHSKSLAQAHYALRKIGGCFRQCGLQLHPDKTRIVYCKDINRQDGFPRVQFTFLGYTFRPRKVMDKYGRVHVNFASAVSRDAFHAMRQIIRGWHVQLKCNKELRELRVCSIRCFGASKATTGGFMVKQCYQYWKHMNDYLTCWLRVNTSTPLSTKPDLVRFKQMV